MNNRWKPIARESNETAADSPRNVTLRVYNLKPMKKFYEDFLGFKLLGEFPSAALLSPGAGVNAQFQMLGLLQRSIAGEPDRSVTARIAFNVPISDHELERKRLESLGLQVNAMSNQKTGKRSLCFRDPEGNEVELFCQWQRQ